MINRHGLADQYIVRKLLLSLTYKLQTYVKNVNNLFQIVAPGSVSPNGVKFFMISHFRFC